MKKTSIVCFAEKNTVQYIKEQFYTIRKFCHGYHSITYVIEGSESDNQEISEYLKLNDIQVAFYDDVLTTQQKDSRLKKIFLTLNPEEFVPSDTEVVVLISPMVMFFIHHTPEYFFQNNNKIQIIAEQFDVVNHLQSSLQNIKNRLKSSKWLFDTDSNLFFGTERMFVLHIKTFNNLRNLITQKANTQSFQKAVDEHININGSDIELIGEFARRLETSFYDIQILKNYPEDLNSFPIKRLYHVAPLKTGQFNSIVNSNWSVKNLDSSSYKTALADTKKFN